MITECQQIIGGMYLKDVILANSVIDTEQGRKINDQLSLSSLLHI